VRPVLVVMAAIDTEHVLEMTAAPDQDPIQAVGRTVRTQHSA
jgi:hypothetical protein